ncbi:hypothetical protein [Streptomyces sp. NPDC050560]|uniref:hypothetical protein n=1 Tax=Streptomyces sp. NPDC050560 TaxID=3365630 RepID=UPI00378ABF82
MGWFRRKRRSGGAAVVTPRGGRVCDCCNTPMEPGAGYLLATKDVVVSPAYWELNFRATKGLADELRLDTAQLSGLFQDVLRQTAGQHSPWSVCEECSGMFLVDRDSARAHSRAGTAPQGTGRVKPSECAQFAAEGWERIFGSWPASVSRRSPKDICDVCRRSVHEGETTTLVPPDRMAAYRAAGLVGTAAGLPSHPEGHTLCHPCSARLFAGLHRAGGDGGEAGDTGDTAAPAG